MIIGSGYDMTAGGAQGTGYTGLAWNQDYGISHTDWYDLNKREQELWIQDINRTDEQTNYYQEEKPWYYEEAQQYEDFTQGEGPNPFQPYLDTTSDIALGIGILGLALLFRR